MGSSEWEVKISSSSSVYESIVFHLVFCICWNHGEVGFNVSKGIDALIRQEQAGKEQKLPSVSLYELPAEGIAHVKGVSSPFKGPD